MAEPRERLLRNLRSIMKGRGAICPLRCLLSRTQPSPGTTRMGARRAVCLCPELAGERTRFAGGRTR
jgi:hypothetical protein